MLKAGHPVVLAGDYNVVPTDADIYSARSWKNDALLQPESRDAYRWLLKQGWTDALRKHSPDMSIFTFWDYFRNHFARDAGLRINHLLMSPAVAKKMTGAGVDKLVRAMEKPSDHAPAWTELADR